MKSSKKWNTIYALVIGANVVFAIIFHILSSIYGNG
jgi:hypothetical protein